MRIPLTLLLGRQGSGKTALLNRLLLSPQWADTLVIWQEAGATALQHPLAAHAPADPQDAAGCACCVRAQDLTGTLINATWRFSRNGRRLFERVVIEAAGDADAAELGQMLAQHPRLSALYCRVETLATLDAATGMTDLAAPQTRATMACADRIIVTGAARVDGAQLGALAAALREINPGATLCETMQPGAEPVELAATGSRGARPA